MTEHFKGHKLVAVGGSSGMGRESAADVVAGGGSAVIVGRDQARVDDTVTTGMSRHGRVAMPAPTACGFPPRGQMTDAGPWG